MKYNFQSSLGDRVVDNRAQWLRKYDAHYRANTPHQRRLAAQRQLLFARYHEIVSSLAGGILMAIIIVICLFLA